MMRLVSKVLLILMVFACVRLAAAQANCVSSERINFLKTSISAPQSAQPDNKLAKELKSLKSKHMSWVQDHAFDRSSSGSASNLPKESEKTVERICSILNSEPWPTIKVVGAEGAANWLYLIKNYFPIQTQLSLMPVIAEAIKQKEVNKNEDLASFIDRVRVRAGLNQLFGTQASLQNDFLVLSPLQSDQNVDKWRAEYGLPPLRQYLRNLEFNYGAPLIKSPAKVVINQSAKDPANPLPMKASDVVQEPSKDDEVLRVETSIVTLDATVYGSQLGKLKKEDFRLFEDGKQQDISYFAPVEAPFDLVLLLDLSGSTAGQVGLIRQTTRKFIEVKRDIDQISLVTFAYRPLVVSPLEADRKRLLESVPLIDNSGGSNVWDALKSSLDSLRQTAKPGRRMAVVIMTDGADNALMFRPYLGSQILFSEILEEVRNAGIAVFPIYLDTEAPDQASPRVYADARRTLKMLADESGGTYYAAKDIGDLSQVYERVMQDIGSVYSLGYSPSNEAHDGSWRTLKVEINGKPDMKVRSRPGYYAK